jgi:hypothetical protein
LQTTAQQPRRDGIDGGTKLLPRHCGGGRAYQLGAIRRIDDAGALRHVGDMLREQVEQSLVTPKALRNVVLYGRGRMQNHERGFLSKNAPDAAHPRRTSKKSNAR